MNTTIISTGLSDPTKRRRIAWPLDNWPAKDRQAWVSAQQAGDFLTDDGAAADWRPVTLRSAIGGYGRWLAFLDDHHLLDPDIGPAERMNPDTIRAYVEFLRDHCASKTVASYIGLLSMMVQAMTIGGNWRWLRDVQARLQRRSKPIRDKRRRMVPVAELMKLGQDLMARAEAIDISVSWRTALDFRDGLMIALLTARPLRQRNFISIEIGRHLIRNGDSYALCFGAGETKGGKPLEFPYPISLLPALERYLNHYRPMLLALRKTRGASRQQALPQAGDRLWVNQYGTPCGAFAQVKALHKHTLERFGHIINPHLFRDCVATSIAIQDPEHVRICAQILGHSSMKPTERYYIKANTLIATRNYHDLILSIRGQR